MKTTYLEYRDGSSNKFWEISVEGTRHVVRFGKVGAAGQKKLKTFASVEAARAEAEALIREKTKKGYAPVTSAPAVKQVSGGIRELVDALVRATTARLEAADREDDETSESMRPRVREPATAAQMKALERAWGRALPPTYRTFLETCNGIENVGGTHLLLGTEDRRDAWAGEQVDSIAEFWDEDEFDVDAIIPLVVPDGDSGIHHIAAFTRGDAEEMEVVDWDNGSPHARYPSFAAYLEHLLEVERSIEGLRGEAREAEAESASPVHALFALEDLSAIEAAVEKLVASKPTAAELEPYFAMLGRDLGSATPRSFARAELAFHPRLVVDATVRSLWLKAMNDAVSRVFAKGDTKRAERWSDVARPFVRENSYLGHNLACAFVAAGRIDDAFEMCKAAVEVGYAQVAKMRADADLGSLLAEERFQKLFGPADRTDYVARTSLPRNAELERRVAAGSSGMASYGAWLTEQGHALGAVVAADLAAEAEAKKERKAKTAAKRLFDSYQKEVLGPAFPALAKHVTHFLDKQYYLSFRYGFLDKLDTFSLNTTEERDEALALLADPHALFVRHVALRKAKLDALVPFAHLHALRQLNFRWTDITQVRSLAPLTELTHLRALDVSNSKVEDLRPVAGLPLLQLYCSDTAVVDLSPLAGHPTLAHVALQNTRVEDLSPLMTCPKLCRVDLWGTPLPRPQLQSLQRYLEKLANEAVVDDALMSGYERGVSHRDT